MPFATSKVVDEGNQCAHGTIHYDCIPTHILVKLLAEESFGKISNSGVQLDRRITNVVSNATSNFQYTLNNLSSQVLQQINQELTCRPSNTSIYIG